MELTIRSGDRSGQTVAIGDKVFVIGRDPSCDLALDDDKVSRRHASIEIADGGAVVRDLGSTNGVFVEGRRITGPTSIVRGQSLRVGETAFLLEGGPTDRPAAAETSTFAPLAPPADPPGAPARAPGNPRIAPPPGSRAERPSGPGAAPPPGSNTSTIRRVMLERSVRRNGILAGVLAALVIVLIVLLVTGVLPPGDDEGGGSVASTVREVTPSTVLVTTMDDGEPVGSGTGWVLDADNGLIVTNHHVVNGGTDWSVGVAGNNRPAKLVGTAPCDDLAVLRVRNTDGLDTIDLGSQDDLEQGQTVVALGYPRNVSERDDLTATEGVVSVVKTRTRGDIEDLPNVVRTSAAINPGNSGGPLVTLDEELVGVNTLGVPGSQNESYSIGVDRVKKLAPRLAAGHSPYWTGLNLLSTLDLPEGTLTESGLPEAPGLVVTGAVARTPGAGADISDGLALIVGVDGRPMDGTTASYCSAVRGQSRVRVQYYRPGSTEIEGEEIEFVG